jgi:uncharacterized protein YbaR (Trm112 family)
MEVERKCPICQTVISVAENCEEIIKCRNAKCPMEGFVDDYLPVKASQSVSCPQCKTGFKAEVKDYIYLLECPDCNHKALSDQYLEKKTAHETPSPTAMSGNEPVKIMKSVRCPHCNTGLKIEYRADASAAERLIICPKCKTASKAAAYLSSSSVLHLWCPLCAHPTAIAAETVEDEKRFITCPHCFKSIRADEYLRAKPAPVHVGEPVRQPDPAPNAPITIVGGGTDVNGGTTKHFEPYYLKLKKGDCRQELLKLVLGTNVIGRRSSDSAKRATTLPIDTADRKVGREHTVIEVVRRGDDTFIHTIKRHENSKNSTHINENALEAGEVLVLRPNDSIRIGDIVFIVTEG